MIEPQRPSRKCFAGAIILAAALVVFSSCRSGFTNYYVGGIQISSDWHVSPIGNRSLTEPTTKSFYFFFHGANVTSVEHMERDPAHPEIHRLLYLEATPNGLLDRTVKSDVLLVGDFGTIYAKKTCFYTRAVESNYSSVSVDFSANGYPSAFENPTQLAEAPAPDVVPTSLSLIKVIRGNGDYSLVAADYEATGELRALHVALSKGGEMLPGNDQASFRLGTEDPRLVKYGIPAKLDPPTDEALRRVVRTHDGSQSVWVVRFYDFGKVIRLQEFRGGVPVPPRWLKPSVTEEEKAIGPECDRRFLQQRSTHLPTTGY